MTFTDPSLLDPIPEPPRPPDLDDCCGGGCDPCVFDLHERAMEAYRKALQEWRARHPGSAPVVD